MSVANLAPDQTEPATDPAFSESAGTAVFHVSLIWLLPR